MRMIPAKKSYVSLRIYFLAGSLVIFFAVLFYRAFQLQVMQAGVLSDMAVRQQTRTVSIQSKRGEIYDRNSKELAVSLEVDSVYAQPAKIRSVSQTAKALAPLISVPRRDLERRLKSGAGFVWLRRQIDMSEEQRRLLAGLDGVGIIKESRRYYPNKALASNIVGFTGIDAKGLEGIELYYDKELKGAPKKFIADADARGRVLMYEDNDKGGGTRGMEVELTLDKTIQFIAEKALRKAVEDNGAKGGTALVMNPMTGEILAMASLPTFDPNDLSTYSAAHGRNKAVADAMEPGSTLKTFLIAAALEENIVRPTDSIYCENGSYKVNDRVFHDTEKHGYLTVAQVLKESSNIGASKVGERLGRRKLHRYLEAFGFGARTNVDVPGEAAGTLRDYKKWNNVALHTVSFGQGVSVTPIQLITALSAVANGGILMKPYAVHTIKDPSGAVVMENNPLGVHRVISEETATQMTRMLVGVTEEGGTGTKAAVEGFDVAGKTGTAQKADLKDGGYVDGAYISSFLGFVPARSPRLAILVTIDEPQKAYYAGTVAAPAFKAIAEQSLSYLGVYRENRNLPKIQLASLNLDNPAPEGKTRAAAVDLPSAMPDFTGATVRSVVRIATRKALDVEIKGSGKAVSQRPAPGHNVAEGAQVTVWFQ